MEKELTEEELLEKAIFNVLSKKMKELCPDSVLNFDLPLCEAMENFIGDIGLEDGKFIEGVKARDDFENSIKNEVKELTKQTSLENYESNSRTQEILENSDEGII